MRKNTRAAALLAVSIGLTGVGVGSAQAAPARPDLVVTAVTWSPTTVARGNPVAFAATIENRGRAATPAGVVHGVGFQVDGVLRTWSDDAVDSLAPGQRVTVTANGGPTGASAWTATTGKHEILAFVDDAGRIAESDEGNNRTKKTFTVAAGPTMTTTLADGVASTTFPSLPQTTGLASSISGAGYGSCHTAAGAVVPGTETYLGEFGTGSTRYYRGGPFADSGLGTAPARSTSATSVGFALNSIVKWNYPTPAEKISCAAGQTPGFTRLHVTELTTNRWTLNDGGWEGTTLLASTSSPMDTDLFF